jgi:hypothetical protein
MASLSYYISLNNKLYDANHSAMSNGMLSYDLAELQHQLIDFGIVRALLHGGGR